MWSKGIHKVSLQASTLGELLVVMVITSVLLLAVTDGLTLFGRYSRFVTDRVTRNARVWDSYCRLESLVASADSLRELPSGDIGIYAQKGMTTFSVEDSLLLSLRKNTKDTLFQSVTHIGISTGAEGIDSLFVNLAVGEDRLRMAFAPYPKPGDVSLELNDLEEKYSYE